MAGKQIYLSSEERGRLIAMTEWELVRCNDEIANCREALHWSIYRAKQTGREPVRSDFSPWLPNPEEDFQAAYNRWHDQLNAWRRDLEGIKYWRAERAEYRKLYRKLTGNG
jgi:hypothetical protein